MSRVLLFRLAVAAAVIAALLTIGSEVAGADVSSGSSQSSMLALERAINAGDVEGALALFTDDAIVWSDGGMVGKQQIRQWLQQQVAAGVEMRSTAYVENGPRTTWVAEISEADWLRAGIGPIRVPGEVVMSRGRIQRLTYTINWTGAHQAPSMGLPAIPAAPRQGLPELPVAGYAGLVGMLGLGAVVIRRARRAGAVEAQAPGRMMVGLRQLARRRGRETEKT